MLNSLENGRYSFIFTSLLVDAITLKSPLKIRSSISVNFYLPFPPLFVNKIILTIPINTSFLYTSAIFHLPIFAYNHSNNLHQKHFSCFSHLANSGLRQGTRKIGGLARTDTVLISPLFFKVWTVITRLVITDSLSPRFRKLVYCR